MASAIEGILEPTLTGLGFELVDAQVSNRGRFLRIFMDKPGGVTLEDCAAVSRHLSRVLEVEGIDYDRLEVSSPGLDRALAHLKDLAPVATTIITQLILSVHPSLPVRDFKEFLAFARKTSPPLHYASGGNGSQHHLSTEMLKQRAGINLVHVPYKSGSPAVAAAIVGDVPVVMAGSSSGPLVKAGKLRAIASTGRERLKLFPDVPTIGEYFPGYQVNNWLGIWAPAGTPEPVILQLRAEINRVLAMPEVGERIRSVGGAEPWITTREEFAAAIQRDYAKYGKLVKDIGARLD